MLAGAKFRGRLRPAFVVAVLLAGTIATGCGGSDRSDRDDSVSPATAAPRPNVAGSAVEDPVLSGCDLPELTTPSIAELRERVAAGVACQAALLESTKALQEDLEAALPQLKEPLRETHELGDLLGEAWSEASFKWKEVGPDGSVTVHEITLTYEEAKRRRDELDDRLQTVGESPELGKYDLQRLYEDYKQALATLAALMQETQDDAEQIIRNLNE
jgi:uncharacterized phage infection (PIP) family protein YhgE